MHIALLGCYNFSCSSYTDLDECSSDPSPCDVSADCTNSDGSYSCKCKQGFTGNGTICDGMFVCLFFSNIQPIVLNFSTFQV